MNIGLILAGGSGNRMKQDIPKQFLPVYDKPIIIYTLEIFQNHPNVDELIVVCLDGWQDMLWAYSRQFNITKLTDIVTGGGFSQESIRNGIFAMENKCDENDIIIVHDGIRPLVDTSVLSDVIVKCGLYGNAVSSLPYNEQMFLVHDERSTRKYIPRETLRRVVTPQAYKYGELLKAYKKAYDEGIGIHESAYTNTMMIDLGETLYFAAGSEKNIKLTTLEDIDIFKALINMEKPNWRKE